MHFVHFTWILPHVWSILANLAPQQNVCLNSTALHNIRLHVVIISVQPAGVVTLRLVYNLRLWTRNWSSWSVGPRNSSGMSPLVIAELWYGFTVLKVLLKCSCFLRKGWHGSNFHSLFLCRCFMKMFFGKFNLHGWEFLRALSNVAKKKMSHPSCPGKSPACHLALFNSEAVWMAERSGTFHYVRLWSLLLHTCKWLKRQEAGCPDLMACF